MTDYVSARPDLRALSTPQQAKERSGPGLFSGLGRLLSLRGETAQPLTDPAAIYWDDLTAANRLKIHLLSSGADVPKEVVDVLSQLTDSYNPAGFALAADPARADAPKAPSAVDRTRLDDAIAVLARLGDDVALDDFRAGTIAAAQRTNHRLRVISFYGSLAFLTAAMIPLFGHGPAAGEDKGASALWGFAMGGLGATASLFLLLLRQAPDEPFKVTDEFDAAGRIILGCVFSTVMVVAIAPMVMGSAQVHPGSPTLAILSIAPFLFGYGVDLVIRVLDRAVQAVQGFFGGELTPLRQSPRRRPSRRRGRVV